MPPKPGSHPPAFNFSQNPTPESPSGPAEQPPENIREEPMRSNSRNFLLSASASRSDDDHPNGIPGGAAQEQYSYHMGAEHVGMPRGAARQVQPTLGDLYCQVQEMETRLRHLELFVFANPNIMRTVQFPPGIITQQVPNDAHMFLPDQRAMGDAQEKSIHRGDLDRVCLPVLEKLSHPPSTVLNDIARQLEPHFPNMFRQELLSVIRRWFRKRREEMSQRIFNAVRKALSSGEYSKEDLCQMADNLQLDDPLIEKVKKDANLEIADQAETISFCHQKIISYLKRTADEMPDQDAADEAAQ